MDADDGVIAQQSAPHVSMNIELAAESRNDAHELKSSRSLFEKGIVAPPNSRRSGG